MSEEQKLSQEDQIRQAVAGDALLFGANREVRRLPEYLNEGEDVFMIVSGSRLGERGRGIIVATSERVIFIWDGWIHRETQDFPYETISSVEFKVGILFGTFTMFGKGDEVAYNWVGRFRGQEFVKKVRGLIAKSVQNPSFTRTIEGNVIPNAPVAPQQPVAAPSVPVTPQEKTHTQLVSEQIQELQRLLDEGYITQADFDAKKQELLGRI
jgi:hypothetical protein